MCEMYYSDGNRNGFRTKKAIRILAIKKRDHILSSFYGDLREAEIFVSAKEATEAQKSRHVTDPGKYQQKREHGEMQRA